LLLFLLGLAVSALYEVHFFSLLEQIKQVGSLFAAVVVFFFFACFFFFCRFGLFFNFFLGLTLALKFLPAFYFRFVFCRNEGDKTLNLLADKLGLLSYVRVDFAFIFIYVV
jgi:hypothetical protein